MIGTIINQQKKLIPSSGYVPPTGNGYTLGSTSITSAGVYSANDTLVRTLWNNVEQSAGSYPTPTWDGINDEGVSATGVGTKIKVLSNNVQYLWEGTIGNNSNINGGPTVHQNFEPINGMCQVGDYIYYSCGYNEHPPAYMKFHKDSPQTKIKVLGNIHYGMTVLYTCTDGTTVYMGGYDPWRDAGARNFIKGINPTNDSQRTFSSGASYTNISNHVYTSVIARVDDIAARQTGMSVGVNHLFVSRAAQNKIDVYNKTTGAFVRALTFTTPKETVCFGSDIWIISGTNTVAKYTVNTDGTLSAATVTLSGLVQPTFITVRPSNGSVAITDEGTSQQIKIFNASGTLTNTLGTAGGYNNGNPNVSTNKFYLTNSTQTIGGNLTSYVFFQTDGRLWVGDIGNFRSLRFSPTFTYEDQIIYMGYVRSMGVDPGNPNRIFCNYLEFSLNYAVPHGNAAWTLVRNWASNITQETDDEFHRLKWVQTLSNGRTYAFQQAPSNLWTVIELDNTTGVRYTGQTFSKSNNTIFMHTGAIRTFKDIQQGVDCWWRERPLTGFDGSNNPVWGTEVQIGVAPNPNDEAPIFRPFVGWNFPPNADTDNMLISFEGGSTNTVFASTKWHLGGVRKGESTWAFKAAKVAPGGINYDGPYPNNGDYDMGNGTQYPGGIILCKEKSIFWGHHGEFWNNKQTNKIQHVYENGLLVGIFGVTGDDLIEGVGYVWDNIPYPGMAGNNIKADIVKVGSEYYIFHCDEGHHGGVHRWKVSGLNTIQEHTINL